MKESKIEKPEIKEEEISKEEEVKMEKLELIDKLKKGEFEQILFTSDLHASKEEEKSLDNLEKVFDTSKKENVEIAIDLGDLEMSEEFYTEFTKKHGVKGLAVHELMEILPVDEDIIKNLLIDREKILLVHYVSYNRDSGSAKICLGGGRWEGAAFNTSPVLLEKFFNKAEKEITLLIGGHFHQPFHKRITERISSITIDNVIKVDRNNSELVVQEPGLYMLNPGCTDRGEGMILRKTDKGYFIRWIFPDKESEKK